MCPIIYKPLQKRTPLNAWFPLGIGFQVCRAFCSNSINTLVPFPPSDSRAKSPPRPESLIGGLMKVQELIRMEQIGISRADALKKLAEKSVDPQFVIESERNAASA